MGDYKKDFLARKKNAIARHNRPSDSEVRVDGVVRCEVENEQNIK